ncbi:MAG: 23S rRNA (uracil(1939)-C(5))-methyltransferase RlmD [Clostridia bacterium]|nr:23S rRNA (uracil(1939)-C(5))-methyltransferase RlmD [Clostridia bacterium]
MDYMNEKRECRFAGKCGACQTLNLTYDRELSMKMKKLITLLGKFGHIDEIIPMEKPVHYRNKVQYLMKWNGGRVNFGLYRASDGGIVNVDNCLMEDREASSVCRTVRKMLDKYKLTVFDGRKGLVRHVMARRGFATGEILCAIVTTDGAFPNAKEFAAELCDRHKNVKSVSRIINTTDTPLWMNGEETVLYGDGFITDVLCGCSFHISAKSFYQINPIQTEVLYNTAVEMAKITERDHVLDSYCGIGTVGIIAAKKGCASLTGFDVNSDAVEDARRNAAANGIENARFICANDKAFEMKNQQHMNVIFADPPRAGCEKRFLQFVLKHQPERFVYISCNPETLARDLAVLKQGGYTIKRIQPVDMFPGTGHVETVVLMSKNG